MSAKIRMKCSVSSVKRSADSSGQVSSEDVSLQAVYANEGPNKEWCKWTPSVQFNFTISNPGAFGKILPGQFYYVDLTETTKDDPI